MTDLPASEVIIQRLKVTLEASSRVQDKKVLELKLDSFHRCVKRIEEKNLEVGDRLSSDFDLQDIVSFNLERAVQQCVDIAAHILADYDQPRGQAAASLFEDLALMGHISKELSQKLAKAAGFRNLLVHRYASIDWNRVAAVIPYELIIFRQFSEAITARCL